MKPPFLFAKILTTGGIVLGLELAASRVMTPFFGVSLYVWSAVLSVTLIALALGYKAGGMLAARLGHDGTMLFFAAAAGLAAVWMNITAWTYPFLFAPLAAADLVLGSIVACLYMLLVPLVILSALNPALVALLRDRDGADHGAGNVFFVSTVGSVLGIFVVAYGLLPHFTNYMTILILTMAAAAVSLAALWTLRGRGWRHYSAAVAAAALSFVVAAGTMATGGLERFTHSFDHDGYSWRITYAAPSYFGHVQVVDVFSADGRQLTRALLNDGMTQNQFSAPGISSRLFTYALERIGAAAAENPQKALVLGVAAGLVPMNYARAGMAVNAVDINPRMIAAAQAQLGLDPRTMNVIVADARTAARDCERDHDIAVIDLFRDDGMPEHLVTYEFFSDVHDCLRERGVMVMNAFMNVEHQESLNALLKTVAAAFGEVTLYTRTPEPGSTFTSAFILARRGGPAGTPAVALDGMPTAMAQALQEALDTGVALRPGDARFAAVPVLTDTANVWKHLALPVEIAYRRGVVGQMPWQVLLN